MWNENLNPDDSETDESEDDQDSEDESAPQQIAEPNKRSRKATKQ